MTLPDCSMAELQAVLLARDLADGEKAIVGTNSDVQVAACNLARCRQAPTLWWVSGPGGMVNCNEPVIRSTARTLCNKIDRMYPVSADNSPDCYRTAVNNAMDQAYDAIDRARSE